VSRNWYAALPTAIVTSPLSASNRTISIISPLFKTIFAASVPPSPSSRAFARTERLLGVQFSSAPRSVVDLSLACWHQLLRLFVSPCSCIRHLKRSTLDRQAIIRCRQIIPLLYLPNRSSTPVGATLLISPKTKSRGLTVKTLVSDVIMKM
jgi:hypothetical protein